MFEESYELLPQVEHAASCECRRCSEPESWQRFLDEKCPPREPHS